MKKIILGQKSLSHQKLPFAFIFSFFLTFLLPNVVYADLVVYHNGLSAGWSDYGSWSTRIDYTSTEQLSPNTTKSLKVAQTGLWGGLQIAYNQPINSADYSTFKFKVWSPSHGQIAVKILNSSRSDLPVRTKPVVAGWQELTFSMSELNPAPSETSFTYFFIHNSFADIRTIYVSDIELVRSSVEVRVAPTIITHPLNQNVTVGQTTAFSVSASGTAPLSYQWKKNGTDISEATSPSFTIPAAVLSDNGTRYQCVVSNSVGSITSTPAMLTVLANVPNSSLVVYHNGLSAGWSDYGSWSTRIDYTSTEQLSPNTTKSLKVAQTDSWGGLQISYNQPINSADYSTFKFKVWSPSNGQIAVKILNSSRSDLPVRTKPVMAGWQELTFSMSELNPAPSEPTFTYFLIQNSTADTRIIYISGIELVRMGGEVNVAPSITSQPQSTAVAVGQNATFTCAASGTPPPTVQWQRNGVIINGATGGFYTLTNVQASNTGAAFNCVASNGILPNAISSTATLTVITGGPTLAVSPTSLNYYYTIGGPTPTSQNIAVTIGNGSASWSATAATQTGGNWLSVSSQTGSPSSGSAIIAVNPAGLGADTYNGIVTVDSGASGSPKTVPVTLTVQPVGGSGPMDISGLHAVGNQLVNSSGQQIIVRGVNTMGLEYACIQGVGWGFTDGPLDNSTMLAMKSWRVNAVRIPLNQSCWLGDRPGINTPNPAYSGVNYRAEIDRVVALANQNNMIPVIELRWSAPGTHLADGQENMPDLDHSIDFWRDVANHYKGNTSVIFDLFGEPRALNYGGDQGALPEAWRCWRDGHNGGSGCTEPSIHGGTYQTVGMQELINTVRATGATNFILGAGTISANRLNHWLAYKPNDPLNNLGASWHVYPDFNACNNVGCYDSESAPVLQAVPVIATEIGQNNGQVDQVTTLMNWIDQHGGGYMAWIWNAVGGTMALVPNNNASTPGTVWGTAYRDHLLQVQPPSASSSQTISQVQVNVVPPRITSQPLSKPINVGQSASLSVVATGSAPLSYQWQRDGVNIAGAKSAAYLKTGVTLSDNKASFICVVSNSAGVAFSNAVKLIVTVAAPKIMTQPVNKTVNVGKAASFSVSASGTAPLKYQWQRNGVDIKGAAGSSYSIARVKPTDNKATFSCRVTNVVSTVMSNMAVLKVN